MSINKKLLVSLIFLSSLFILLILLYSNKPNNEVEETFNATTEEKKVANVPEETKTLKDTYSLHEPDSPWILVNKHNSLPVDYIPDLVVPSVRLRLNSSEEQMKFSSSAVFDLEKMFAAASKDGVVLVFGSGYRSATLQRQFYESYVASDGQALADTYSARPGYSEHQTGLTVDITSTNGVCHLEICWEDTIEGKWVAKNAYKYGFFIRYPKNKTEITGYQYEPWHIRHVGVELATEIESSGLTYEEYFDQPPAPTYL